mmetsp:Transcript_36870/g.45079  ORF Transcript_36870/g.45079 Transcript_36870/m.45079 type:complete len:154 (+) Transcript_36870:110-571(+)|eukprot:CAMPEP_0172491632 /NCGR_PEP_ID=MMETSP1066-20121228/22519_1 /TAXON_ID=671091 /ORGANISM="Coscinodiscus wailesii, Strain CCMP2513" /LENGTH=153 /DNA_ID=CAMNT_0013260791 /DNA_START=85 /DNA_END=546 /DNA_ORIENTATION=-
MIKLLFALIGTLVLLSTGVSGTDDAGREWLEQKSREEGVVTLPSGLMYKEIRAGSGKTPGLDHPCECHYQGTLIDGTEFDSSYKRGKTITFSPKQVIKGWTEAMQIMQEGGIWELYIPSELGYGKRGAGEVIPGNAALQFKLELVKVLEAKEL